MRYPAKAVDTCDRLRELRFQLDALNSTIRTLEALQALRETRAADPKLARILAEIRSAA